DPSEAMLAVAQRHARNEGIDHRCHVHVGLVSSLSTGSFDAATSVLVSHFLADAADRQAYFASIADRLKPGGLFFNADLCGDRAAPSFDGLMELWLRVAGMPEDRKPFFRAAFGKALAVQGPAEVEALMAAAGFAAPAPCFQATLIRGWFTHRAPTGGSGPGPDHAGRDNRLFPPPPGDFSGK
ncbi:MAG TPA: class I SAM-dependent methyltransferase, partial [Myxococcota bacterium]|nr:class I SAM-dependent methyltransferase [Myxococcota bacterium]